jgi:hypothetical protein
MPAHPSYRLPWPPCPPHPQTEISVLTGQATSVSIQQVVQLGMFSIITYAVELLLELGFMKMAATIIGQIIQGAPTRGWAALGAGEVQGLRVASAEGRSTPSRGIVHTTPLCDSGGQPSGAHTPRPHPSTQHATWTVFPTLDPPLSRRPLRLPGLLHLPLAHHRLLLHQ